MALLKILSFSTIFLRPPSFGTFCSIFSDFYGSIEKFLVFLGFSTSFFICYVSFNFFRFLWLY
ncbi:MAG: hypothetical protein EBT07_03150 [Actinobacteria bacterium]|nr:hypothetical protein [Actinomycetota bacterium]